MINDSQVGIIAFAFHRFISRIDLPAVVTHEFFKFALS